VRLLLLQAKAVYEQRSPLNALDGFTKPVAFFQVSWRWGR